MEEEIICPNCGSSDCEKIYLTANNAKKVGKALLGWGVAGPLGGMIMGGKELLDSDKNKDEFECNDCGHTFTRQESMEVQEYLTQQNPLLDDIEESFEADEYEAVIEMCDEVLSSDCDDDERCTVLEKRALSYMLLGFKCNEKFKNPSLTDDEKKKIDYDEKAPYLMRAMDDFETLQKTYGDSPIWCYHLARCYFSLPPYKDSQFFDYRARRYAIAALDTDDCEFQSAVQNYLDNSINKQLFDFFNQDVSNCTKEDKEFFESFKFTSPTNEYIPFSDRQFIMFAKSDDKMAGYHDPDDNIKWVFSVNNYPNDIKIEGLPQPNILYMANPVKKDTYLPYENAEEVLFQSKVREFEYLVGCLGATSIRFRSLKGKKVSSEREVDRSAGAEVDLIVGGGGVNVNWGSKENRNTSTSSELGRNQKLNPTKYPFIPEDLGWYNLVEEWRDFARQRLQNGLTHYHYIFKSSESSSLSTQKKLDISASFKKMALSINAHYSQNIKESIAIQEETEWEVEVDFKPLEEFANQSGNAKKSGFVEIPVSNVTLNDNEQFYYDELQDVLADGVITENDRKRLERRRQRLNISEERAKEIEQMLSPSLTEDEQEYYDELFEVLDDGVIDDKERRSLDRLKRSLGISDSRAKEIEDMAFAKRGLK